MLVFGRIADVYGRKRTFIFGASFTTILTLACAFPKGVCVSKENIYFVRIEVSIFFSQISRVSQFSEVFKE